jgi:hypothetical protein
MMPLTSPCDCCDNCLNQTFEGCTYDPIFYVPGLPDQKVTAHIKNLATGRLSMLETESQGEYIEFKLSEFEIELTKNQTYKIVLKDEAGTIIDFDLDGETYNCTQILLTPAHVIEKKPSPVY